MSPNSRKDEYVAALDDHTTVKVNKVKLHFLTLWRLANTSLKEGRKSILFVSIFIKLKPRQHEVMYYLGGTYVGESGEEKKEENYSLDFRMGVSSGWMDRGVCAERNKGSQRRGAVMFPFLC